MIIGFCGKLNVGKDFISRIFKDMLKIENSIHINFADELKKKLIIEYNIPYEQLYNQKTEYSRKMLQDIGTKMKEEKGENYWINCLITNFEIYKQRGVENLIITDFRYQNEIESIKKYGEMNNFKVILIKIVAPNRNTEGLKKQSLLLQDKIKNHHSEINLDNTDNTIYNYVLFNDFEDDIFLQIRNTCLEINSIYYNEMTIFCDLDDTLCECNRSYNLVQQKVLYLLKGISKNKDKEMDTIFNKEMGILNSNFHNITFYRNRFSDDLLKTAKKVYFNINNERMEISDEIRIYKLAMSVHDNIFEPKINNIMWLNKIQTEFKNRVKIVIFTLGDIIDQQRKRHMLGLNNYILESHLKKDRTMFDYLKNKYKSKDYLMVGDSLERDIKPAIEAGIKNVFLLNDTEKQYFEIGNYMMCKDLQPVYSYVKGYLCTE